MSTELEKPYTVIVTNSDWEIATHIAGPFLHDLAERFNYKWDTIELRGSLDVYNNYIKVFKEGKTRLHFGCGHGAPPLYTGWQNRILQWTQYQTVWGKDIKPEYVRGAIHYLLSCLTAQMLGKYLVDVGGSAYIGWYKEYKLVVGNKDDPYNDPYAKSTVRYTGLAGLDILIEGGTVGEAEAHLKKKFKEYYEAWKDKNPMIAGVIAWNMEGLRVYGLSLIHISEPTRRS